VYWAAIWLECCQVTLLPVYEDLEDKVPWNILNTVTGGMGNVIKATLQKMLDNVSFPGPFRLLMIISYLF